MGLTWRWLGFPSSEKIRIINLVSKNIRSEVNQPPSVCFTLEYCFTTKDIIDLFLCFSRLVGAQLVDWIVFLIHFKKCRSRYLTCWFAIVKCVKKQLRKSETLIKDAGHNQQTVFCIGGTSPISSRVFIKHQNQEQLKYTPTNAILSGHMTILSPENCKFTQIYFMIHSSKTVDLPLVYEINTNFNYMNGHFSCLCGRHISTAQPTLIHHKNPKIFLFRLIVNHLPWSSI